MGTALGGRYLLEHAVRDEVLGRLFDGTDLGTHGHVTVKVLDPRLSKNDKAVHRFRKEGAALAAVQQANIPRVLDAGVHHDLFDFLVTERFSGAPLADEIRTYAPMPMGRVAAIAIQIARALSAAHQVSILHRNVCPEAVVLLDNADGGDFAMLSDFGNAYVGLDDEVELAGPSGFVGTLATCAPEYLDRAVATEAGDVYALGVVMYLMLTGTYPFVGPDGVVVDGHVRHAPAPPSDHLDGKSTWLDELVLMLLSKDPKARPTASQVVHDLQRGTGSNLTPPPLMPVGVAVRRAPSLEQTYNDRATRSPQSTSLVDIGAMFLVAFAVFVVAVVAYRLATLGSP